MFAEDGGLYVVKFQNNPQGIRVLANEFLATRLAHACGFTVPRCEVVEVVDWLVEGTPDLEAQFSEAGTSCTSHLHFGSAYVGGLAPGNLVDYMPDSMTNRVRNVTEFAGMVAFDAWCGNADPRQAVYRKKPKETRYDATFIDQGSCFRTDCFKDGAIPQLFPRNTVYAGVTGWESFEPWLSAIRTMPPEVIWEAAYAIPSEWWGPDRSVVKELVETLIGRKSLLKELVTSARYSSRKPFPRWTERRSPARTIMSRNSSSSAGISTSPITIH
jgi:hypothetical protein